MLFDLYPWSYRKMTYQVVAILDFANMAAPAIFSFGALNKWVQYGLTYSYICARFRACR